ncbi:hypothetical protein ACEPAG_5803 [Sanghuangporus baumii]
MTHSTIPAGVLDASHATDHIILSGWVLDQPVNPAKIKVAWIALTESWPVLLARLRKNALGQLEYIIPHGISLSGSFAALAISDSIHNHYSYTRPSQTISCVPKRNPHHLFLPYAPKSIQELMDSDKPMCHLHVTNFDDAALIGLSVPHLLCDASGVAIIIKALCTLINSGAKPRPLNHHDPFASYKRKDGVAREVPAPPHWRLLTRLDRAILYIRQLWEHFLGSRVDNYDIFIPQLEVQRMKTQAMRDISIQYGSNTGRYVSTSDVVLAFLLQCTHSSSTSHAPLNVFYTFNMRGALGIREPFIHNAVAMVVTPPIPCSSVSKMTLGSLSLLIRDTLMVQTTPDSLKTWICWRLCNAGRPKSFFRPLNGRWNVVTNARAMNLMDIDFTGALDHHQTERQDGDMKTVPAVRCVYAWGNGIQPYQLRNWIGIWADDPSGGIWASAFLPTSVWKNKEGFGRFISS